MDAASLASVKKHSPAKTRLFSLVRARSMFLQAWVHALLLAGLFLSGTKAEAAPPPGHKEIPIGFFTNIATMLLKSQLDMDLHRIQLYPTNQYNASVHRLLQVAANLYDATTNHPVTAYPYLPSVFRPVFTNDHGAIFIAGYTEVTNTALLSAPMRDLANPSDRAELQTEDMIYGVPLVVGVRKGFPNFNEFSMETAVSVMRQLQFIAPVNRDPRAVRPTETNQMYVVGISNVFGLEGWNSYSNAYPRPLQLIVEVDLTSVITNEFGKMLVTNRFTTGTNQIIPASTWDGFRDFNYLSNSFQIPFPPATSHFPSLTNSSYSHGADAFMPLTQLFETDQAAPFALPHWWLLLNTRLRFILVDTAANRIVDYVNLASADQPINITFSLMLGADCAATYNPARQGFVPNGLFWCTNRGTPFGPTFGARLQIDVSAGLFDADWKSSQSILPGSGLRDRNAGIDFFRSNFFGYPPKYGSVGIYQTNVFYSPFNPIRTLYIATSWQANDPLVHYTVGDLQALTATNRITTEQASSQQRIANIGRINDRYEPWGGNPTRSARSITTYAIQLKDPLVRRSDDWDFPQEEHLRVELLGRVHRGTPWQTLYLKSPAIEPPVWSRWIGFADSAQTAVTLPTNDWRLVSSLIPLIVKEHPHQLVSINQASTSDWRDVLKGMRVLTNTLSDDHLGLFTVPQFDSLVMRSKSPQIETIIADIEATREKQPFQIWGDRADILATPTLSVNSPWLHLNRIQAERAITDEAVEKIPSQILQLLRSDSIGSVHQFGSGRKIQFTGMTGNRYVLEISSDLLNWTAVATNYPANGTLEFTDDLPESGQNRFYRSILLP
jgi:hypothetical protein